MSGAFSAIGDLFGGYEQNQMAQYNAKVLQNQALVSEQKAEFDMTRQREAVQRLLSTQRARFAAAGVTFTSGSPLQVMEKTAEQGELDAQAIRYTGALQAAGYRSKAAMSKWEGKVAQVSSYFKAGSSLLSTS